MEREKDDEQGFRVVDRRRFDSSGDVRAGGYVAEEPPSVARTEKKAERQTATKSAPPPSKSALDEDSTPATIDFSSFVVSLATQALIMLGEVPSPDSQQMMFNKEAARETIDIIALLEEKTRGNLTADETKLIGDVLASLRLAYVRKAK